MPPSPTPVRVLHVDDDPEFVEIVAALLERERDPLAVETATCASEGLSRLRGSGFDCVVSDYRMPGRNGIEFLEAVRTDHPDVPFVLFTGVDRDEVAAEAGQVDVAHHFRKGAGPDQYAALADGILAAVGRPPGRSG